MSVLILAGDEDDEAVRVSYALTQKGVHVWWFDTSWFPARASIEAEITGDGWQGVINTPDASIELNAVSAVYYRHSQPFSFPSKLSEQELRFATVEARFGIGGLLSSLPAYWASHPSAVADAEYRIVQMASAVRAGLHVPASLITNDPVSARRFVDNQDHGAVYKAIMHKIVSEEGRIKLIYTSTVDAVTVDDRVRVTPHLFQSNVPKVFDTRVVVTGHGVCLGVAIRTVDPVARQDWRTHYDRLTYDVVDVPQHVVDGCLRCLADLGVQIGVFDFSVDRAGDWWFLEVNPSGAWAWLAEATGLPIAEAVADLLVAGGGG
ncbi:MvdC/MvdD family ATP grasp protein [Sinosporangium siamense]|uniref:ATP-grasp ribosomal peptide maturase n=1 Tax=Sinosporangium siamense TaxID=1367973 RepID=A0A919RR01_9ACTN|nr:hypothetical protein [Sinosporangium siamense]GII97124.1 ATP-grasp ribosomal peptide maturase [Sinosporangium siamense]